MEESDLFLIPAPKMQNFLHFSFVFHFKGREEVSLHASNCRKEKMQKMTGLLFTTFALDLPSQKGKMQCQPVL